MQISHEQYVTTFNQLPYVVRSYIIDDSIIPIIEDIAKKYAFHVDVTGKLKEQSTYLLMGLMSPAELLGELVLADVPAETAKSVLQDLNALVFTPLQKQMREVPKENPEEEILAPKTEPPETITAGTALPDPLPSTNAPEPERTPTPLVPTPSVEVKTIPVVPSVEPQTGVRTMTKDIETIMAAPAVSTLPTKELPQPSAPADLNPVPASWTPIQPPAPIRLTPIEQVHQNTPIIKEYGTDPYRETISE